MRLPRFSRRARWAVPAGALAVTGAVIAAALVPSGQASPVLPVRTAAQLLAAVGGGTGSLAPFTGTVVEKAVLGLPDLPGVDNPASPTSLLAGSHTVRIWYASPSHVRLAMPEQLSESDVVRNGRTVWFWQSKTNSVTRLRLPAGHGHTAQPKLPVLTPQQAAKQAIAAVGPTTRVSVQTNIVVAGEPAYQLVLAPKSTSSLVGQVRIAVDARHSVPLRVQVYARRASSPAFQVGFQSISFATPAAANFNFSVPPGAKVSTDTLGGHDMPAVTPHRQFSGGPQVIGSGWLAVAVLPASGLPGGVAGQASSAAGGVASSAARSAAGSGGGGVPASALLGAAMRAASPVHGAWGSGRLLRTSLLSVLVTSDGHVLAGAVTPAVLYAAAAHVK